MILGCLSSHQKCSSSPILEQLLSEGQEGDDSRQKDVGCSVVEPMTSVKQNILTLVSKEQNIETTKGLSVKLMMSRSANTCST